MKEVIETLESETNRYETWIVGINKEIYDLEKRLRQLGDERTRFLNKIESLNEAIWKLQNETQ